MEAVVVVIVVEEEGDSVIEGRDTTACCGEETAKGAVLEAGVSILGATVLALDVTAVGVMTEDMVVGVKVGRG